MTAFGKILVILNFVASIAVAFFIMLVFATRTKWSEAHKELDASFKALKGSADADKASYDAAAVEADKTIKELQAKLAQKQTELTVEKGNVQKRNEELTAARQQATSESAAKAAIETDLARHKDEVAKLAAAVKEKDEAILRTALEKNELRDQQVRSSIEASRHKLRVEQLAANLQEITKENERLRKNGGSSGSAALAATTARENPPPGNVEGLVTEVAPGGLVTISIGSDAGLAVGHTLDVYRLAPKDEYLGQLQIVSVKSDKAVGQLMKRTTKTSVQVRDRVGTLGSKS